MVSKSASTVLLGSCLERHCGNEMSGAQTVWKDDFKSPAIKLWIPQSNTQFHDYSPQPAILTSLTMFARISSVIALALCASASVLPRTQSGGGGGTNQCNTGPVQCCNQVQSVRSTLSIFVDLIADWSEPYRPTTQPLALSLVFWALFFPPWMFRSGVSSYWRTSSRTKLTRYPQWPAIPSLSSALAATAGTSLHMVHTRWYLIQRLYSSAQPVCCENNSFVSPSFSWYGKTLT